MCGEQILYSNKLSCVELRGFLSWELWRKLMCEVLERASFFLFLELPNPNAYFLLPWECGGQSNSFICCQL